MVAIDAAAGEIDPLPTPIFGQRGQFGDHGVPRKKPDERQVRMHTRLLAMTLTVLCCGCMDSGTASKPFHMTL